MPTSPVRPRVADDDGIAGGRGARGPGRGRPPGGWARDALVGAAFHLLVVLFGLMTLAWSLPAGPLRHLMPRRRGEALGRAAIATGFRWFLAVLRTLGMIRCDLGALDALRDERSLLVACNHPTLMDAVLLVSRLPRAACITKASLWNSPFLGGGVRLAGYVRNDGALPMVRGGVDVLRRGHQVLVFPEGTRTAGGVGAPPGRFSRSAALMARAAGAPVQTVLIEAETPYLARGWPLFRRPPLPLVFRVRLGRRFRAGDDAAAFTAELERYFRAALAAPPG